MILIEQVQNLEPGDRVRIVGYGYHRVTVEGPVVELAGALWVGDVVRLVMRDGGLPSWAPGAELTVLATAGVKS